MAQAQAHSKRSTKFLKDLGIYAIGNLGSKIITFAMVPLYTFFVKDTSDFGYYDLCFTMVLLLLSPATLQLRDGAFRFLIDNNDNDNRKRVITFSYTTLLLSAIITLLITLVLYLTCDIKYVWLTYLLLMSMSFYEVISQITRALNCKNEFVVSGILSALSIGVFSIIFVGFLSMGVIGIFLANILARIVAIAYLELKLNISRTFFDINIDYWNLGKKILKYSLPLMPGMMCWWLASSSDRFFISNYIGLETNGIYAIAVRFTGLIYNVTTIFYMAWQDSAIIQYTKPDKDTFFSQMANTFIFFLAFLFINYTLALKILYPYIVGENYQPSLNYVYALCISALFFSIAQFLDLGYQCSKETSRILPSYIMAAVVNIGLNIILIKCCGVYGAIISINAAFLLLLIYRIIDTSRYFKILIDPKSLIPISLIALSAVPYYFINSWILNTTFIMLCNIIMVILMPNTIKSQLISTILRKKQ